MLDRYRIERVRCSACSSEQAPAQYCKACGHCFGEYTCLICNYFDDDVSKKQFHCAHCGICRVGGRHNFFHCDTCGCCYETQVQVRSGRGGVLVIESDRSWLLLCAAQLAWAADTPSQWKCK